MSNAMPLKSNLHLEVINIWGVHFVSLSLCQSKCILEVMDYLSKWMKHFLCCGHLEEFKEDDSGITFPCFEFPRVMFGSEGSHITRQDLQEVSQRIESKTTGLLLHTIPIPMARQKHLTRRSETFCRRCHGERME